VEGDVSVTALRRLEAPSENGGILAAPPLAETGRLLADNRRCFQQSGPDILGRSWIEIRQQAQAEALAAAKDYFHQAGESLPPSSGKTFFLAGHQPDLFHPGVWIKNFALNGLARAHGAIPLNLIVDSDTAKTISIRVPGLVSGEWSQAPPHHSPLTTHFSPDQVKLLTIPIDRWTREAPYEELRVVDEATFAGVEGEVTRSLRAWGFESMFGAYWQTVLRQSRRTNILGERLAAARRAFERNWNCHNLELPVSGLCRTASFAWFACHLLAHLPRFHAIYNDSIRSYRERYGLRSQSHPVPELATQNGWLETPFWAWRTDQPRRLPLLARPGDDAIELRLENETVEKLPLTISDDNQPARGEKAVAVWQELESKGIKMRSRALMTTLFARLFLGDLFIHGIGGGKYDELTDEIIRRFYEIEPPAYLILSGTLHLPLPVFPRRPRDCRQLARELRDFHWNPQRHIDKGMNDERGAMNRHVSSSVIPPSSLPHELVENKAEWVARQPVGAAEKHQRFQKLRELTASLRFFVNEKERLLQEELVQCRKEVHANRILQSRDFAFCLYPEETLRPFCTQFLAGE
jgi:hypothetical protein